MTAERLHRGVYPCGCVIGFRGAIVRLCPEGEARRRHFFEAVLSWRQDGHYNVNDARRIADTSAEYLGHFQQEDQQ